MKMPLLPIECSEQLVNFSLVYTSIHLFIPPAPCSETADPAFVLEWLQQLPVEPGGEWEACAEGPKSPGGRDACSFPILQMRKLREKGVWPRGTQGHG